MQDIIKMPHLGETMEEGKIVSIYVKEGDFIKKGDLLFDVETDKTVLTVESYKDGFVRKIFIKPDDVVKIGEPILLLTSTENEPIEEKEMIKSSEEEKKEDTEKTYMNEEKLDLTHSKKVLASPLAKKLAKDYGIDLFKIKPKGDIIRKEDIEIYMKNLKEKINIEKERVDLSYSRKIIGSRMKKAKNEIPHFYLTISLDMSKVKETKDLFLNEKGLSLSYTDFILKALSSTLLKYKFLNAHFVEEGVIDIFNTINIGMAVDAKDTLIVPVLKNIENKSLREISTERKMLVEKALSNKLLPQDTEGATFTISNLGPYGILEFSAIINPPQVAILAIGKITYTPMVIDQEVAVRPVMKVTLSADHRVIDGAYGAKFLDEFKKLLENPVLLWE